MVPRGFTGRRATRQAIAEIEKIGRDTRLSRCSFERAHAYFLTPYERTHDSRTTVRVVQGYHFLDRGPKGDRVRRPECRCLTTVRKHGIRRGART